MPNSPIPTASDIMTRKLVTLRPDTSVIGAMRTLVEHRVSGAPVLDSQGRLCGILSELDCIRILTSGQFSQDSHDEDACVADVMTRDVVTIGPNADLFVIAQQFLSRGIRRLPVLDGDVLLGMVSRRDVLAGVDKMRHATRTPQTQRRAKGLYLSANSDSDEIDSLLD